MGNFFTNISVLMPGLTPKKLAMAMAKLHYRPSNAGSTLYILPKNGRWCTLHADWIDMLTDTLPNMLSCYSSAVLMICCFDSDYLLLQLTRNRYTETVCVGEPYDFDEIDLQFTPEHWQPVVHDLDAFLTILDDDYVYIEDCLEPLGQLMGFDAAQIRIMPDDLAANPPDQMRTMYFANAAASSTQRVDRVLQSMTNLPRSGAFLDERFGNNSESGVHLLDEEDL